MNFEKMQMKFRYLFSTLKCTLSQVSVDRVIGIYLVLFMLFDFLFSFSFFVYFKENLATFDKGMHMNFFSSQVWTVVVL